MSAQSVTDDDYDELIYHVPKQKKPTHTNSMGASVSIYPSLGQITQVQKQVISVTALLEVPADQAKESWELAVWHSEGDDNWTETILSLAPPQRTPSNLQNVDTSKGRLWFAGKLDVKTLLNFTAKFRSGSDQPWRWARDEQGIEDGTVIYKAALTTDALSDDLGSILKGYDTDIKVKSCQSQCPGTRLWALEASVDPAQGDDSTYANVNLGTPWGGFLRYVSFPWLVVRHIPLIFVLLHARAGGFHSSVYGPLGSHLDTEKRTSSWTRTPFCPPSSTPKGSTLSFSQSVV